MEGGVAAGGQLLDQRLCPCIVVGELRYNMVDDECVGIIHQKPKDGGLSAVAGTSSVYTCYGQEKKLRMNLTDNSLSHDVPKVMPALGLGEEAITLWRTVDFIYALPVGTQVELVKRTLGKFSSCVGISECLAAYCKDVAPKAHQKRT